MTRILIFDTTLRDGEQSPGCSMTSAEKLRLAHELGDLGVDIMEAGFPASSEEAARAITMIASEVRGPVIAALARATPGDIAIAAEALSPAPRPRIHTFIATSEIHLKHKLGISQDQCIDRAGAAVERARSLVDDVEFSAEDATRSDIDFLCRIVEVAVRAGATTVNIPDTVGYTLPGEMEQIIRTLLERVPGLRDQIVSVHCHNDLGLAVANSLAAVGAGARQVECTINGIGERAGNAALEEVVMALKVRNDLTHHDTGIHTERLHRTSRLLSYVTGVHPQPNKAIVGRNAFAHEAGIHQHGVLNHPLTYEIMTPAMVGAPASTLVLGRHSGRHGLQARYRELGYELSSEEMDRVTAAFKVLADRKKEILDEDLLSILHHGVMEDVPEVYRIVSVDVHCGGPVSDAKVALSFDGGEPRIGEAEGDGPIAAVFDAIERVSGVQVVLEDLKIRAATRGEDAVGEVNIKARVDGQLLTGRGGHTDVVVASAHAYIHVLNKAAQIRALEERQATADAGVI